MNHVIRSIKKYFITSDFLCAKNSNDFYDVFLFYSYNDKSVLFDL